jgi:hypothetical protein
MTWRVVMMHKVDLNMPFLSPISLYPSSNIVNHMEPVRLNVLTHSRLTVVSPSWRQAT